MAIKHRGKRCALTPYCASGFPIPCRTSFLKYRRASRYYPPKFAPLQPKEGGKGRRYHSSSCPPEDTAQKGDIAAIVPPIAVWWTAKDVLWVSAQLASAARCHVSELPVRQAHEDKNDRCEVCATPRHFSDVLLVHFVCNAIAANMDARCLEGSAHKFGRAPKYRTKGRSRYWCPKFAARKWLKCYKNQCSRSRAVSGRAWTPFCVILWGWLKITILERSQWVATKYVQQQHQVILTTESF